MSTFVPDGAPVAAVPGAPAIEGFVRGHRDRLLRLAVLITRNWPDAHDAVQDAFAKLYPRWSSLPDDAGRREAYVRRCVVNASLGIEATPSAVPTSPGQVSIRNDAEVDFDRVVVNFSDQPVDYGPVRAGATTRSFPAVHAYGYAYGEVTVDGRKYAYQPDDHVGESPLPPGDHVYVLNLVEGQLSLRLE